MTRVLLGHLGSNGDCLYATALARQIKADFPGCHLTWAVSSLARRVLDNNPDIDAIWEIPLENWHVMEHAWTLIENEAHRLRSAGIFDEVFLTQISPAHFENYDGTIRPSIFRNYPRPITGPVDVTIRLTEEEKARVERWYASSPAAEASATILFECSSKSGQSFVTPALAVEVAEAVLSERKKAVVILSTHESVKTDHPRILNAGSLTLRETAWLTRYIDLFVGCGSGVTVVATSAAAKPNLPTIQLLKRSTSVYASFRHDFEHFGKPTDRFLEITKEDPATIAQAITAAMADGFPAAKAVYDDPVPVTFDWYLELVSLMLLDRGKYLDAAQSLLVTAGRYGWRPQLLRFARYSVAPFLQADPRIGIPRRREDVERFRAAISRIDARADPLLGDALQRSG